MLAVKQCAANKNPIKETFTMFGGFSQGKEKKQQLSAHKLTPAGHN